MQDARKFVANGDTLIIHYSLFTLHYSLFPNTVRKNKNPSCFSTGRERIRYTRGTTWITAPSHGHSHRLTRGKRLPYLHLAFRSLLESVIHTSSVMRFALSRNHCERYPVLLVFVMAFILLTLYTPSHPFVKRFCGHLTKKPILQLHLHARFG